MARGNMIHRAATDERGAILIHVAIAILMFTAMLSFVLDNGVLWTARRQAQNAADAGALASGMSLIYDNFKDRTDTGPAHLSGVETAKVNQIYGQAPGVITEQSRDATLWTPDSPQTCKDALGTCAQVSVFRDGTNGGAVLPVVFGQALGKNSQKVRATATIQLLAANANQCIKPWIIKDRSPNPYTLSTDVGTVVTWVADVDYRQADFPASGANCPGGAGTCYSDAVVGCVGKSPVNVFTRFDDIHEQPVNLPSPTDLVLAQDPGASWNGVEVVGSCALTHSCACADASGKGCANGLNGAISPRILPIALFAPADVDAMAAPGPQIAQIQNFAGLFIIQSGTKLCADPTSICGYLVPISGVEVAGPALPPGGSLNVLLSLIR